MPMSDCPDTAGADTAVDVAGDECVGVGVGGLELRKKCKCGRRTVYGSIGVSVYHKRSLFFATCFRPIATGFRIVATVFGA